MKNLKIANDGDFQFQTAPLGNVTEVEISYMKHDNLNRRGVYARMTAVKLEQGNGYVSKSFELFNGGVSGLLVKMARKHPKIMEEVARAVDDVIQEAVRLFEAGQRNEALALITARVQEKMPAFAVVTPAPKPTPPVIMPTLAEVISYEGDEMARRVVPIADLSTVAEVVGRCESTSVRPELFGQPTLKGYCGPMWGGGLIRYESAAANDLLSV